MESADAQTAQLRAGYDDFVVVAAAAADADADAAAAAADGSDRFFRPSHCPPPSLPRGQPYALRQNLHCDIEKST
jgi:hypothetical protein